MAETFKYRKAMLNGGAHERAEMIVAERSLQAKQAKEQSQDIEQNKREKEELTQSESTNQNKKIGYRRGI